MATALDPLMESERLRFSPPHRRELRVIFPIVSKPENYAYEICPPSSKKDLKGELRRTAFPRGFRKSGRLLWGVRKEDDGELIGTIVLQLQPDFLQGEIGIIVDKQHQAQGFGGEMVARVVRFAMETLRLHRVTASCDAANEACARIFVGLGFRKEAHWKEWFAHPKRGWIDGFHFALLLSEWEAREKKAGG